MDISASQPIKPPQSFPLNQNIVPNPNNLDAQAPTPINMVQVQYQDNNTANINYPNYPISPNMQNPQIPQIPQNASNNQLLLQILKGQEEQKNREKEKEIQELKEKLNEERFKQLQSDNENIKANQRMQAVLITQGQSVPNININNNNNNNNVNVNENNNNISSNRLIIPIGMWCIILLINLFLPGVGSIVAGIMYGRTAKVDRTGIIICHGIFQLLTFFFAIGWIWALVDTLNYFG